MFCTNCGANVAEGLKFCTECGADLTAAAAGASVSASASQPVGSPSQPVYQQPVYQQPVYQQPVYQQPVYQQPAYQGQAPAYAQPVYQTPIPVRKKKRHVGLYVLLTVLIILAAGIIYMLGSLSLFGPKNLGVKYTQADFNSAIQKLGIHVTADLGNGQTYDNAPILAGSMTSKGTSTITSATLKNKLPIADYNWTFGNYKQTSVTLTPAEATAFFNEIAPNFWWFDKTQVKITSDGKIISSSSANIKKIKEELYADVAGDIPIPLPNKVNLYTEGDFSITNNKISMVPDVIKVGPVSVPEQYLGGDNLNVFSDYLDRFFTIIPDLKINNAGVKNGNFVFDGVVPTEVSVTPKN